MTISYQCGARRRLPAAAALLAGLAATPALADVGTADITWLNTPVIVVEGNGNVYNKVVQPGQNIDGKIKVHLDAGVSGRVRSWEAWPTLSPGDGTWKAIKGTGMSRSASYDSPRPKTVNEEFNFSIPLAHYATTVIAACNGEAARLRAQGLDNAAIFGQHRAALFVVDVGLTYDMSGIAGSDSPQEVGQLLQRTVTCKGTPPRVPNPIADASLLIRTGQANTHSGACELRLHGAISTDVPNVQVKFRYVYGDGQKSDLKTVATDAKGFVNFTHKYPLATGIKGGKIRMVGEGPTFQSDWEDFEADCGAPTDKVSVLPPKAADIIFGVREEVAHRGLLCPSVISVEGVIEGRGKASGAIALFAGGKLKKLQQYSIEDGHSVLVQGEHALTWGPTQAQQNVKLAMNVTNASAAIVDQLEKTVNVTCRQVQTSGVGQGAPGGVATNPKPVLTLNVSAAPKEKLYKGFACPAKVLADGRVLATYAMEGRAIHVVAQQGVAEPQQQVDETKISLVQGQNLAIGFEPELRWSNVPVVGGNPPKQTLKFTFMVSRDNKAVATVQKSLVVSCRKPQTSGVGGQAPGGVSTGKPKPTHSQETVPAEPQTAPLIVVPVKVK